MAKHMTLLELQKSHASAADEATRNLCAMGMANFINRTMSFESLRELCSFTCMKLVRDYGVDTRSLSNQAIKALGIGDGGSDHQTTTASPQPSDSQTSPSLMAQRSPE